MHTRQLEALMPCPLAVPRIKHVLQRSWAKGQQLPALRWHPVPTLQAKVCAQRCWQGAQRSAARRGAARQLPPPSLQLPAGRASSRNPPTDLCPNSEIHSYRGTL